jgi:SpoVK/Ycf46/Vps4 family AAA+-type ATPase
MKADKVTSEHFKQALKKITPSVSKDILDKYEEMAAAKKELLPAYG